MFDTESTESKVVSMLEAFSRAEFATSAMLRGEALGHSGRVPQRSIHRKTT